ncbi:MAG: transcription antitermination factor NusB [Verrucomicrobiales bacterium]|nr:transcription antitermination factor NusB [Verrucomicrobiae bacterium]MCC6884228.1 transcription antitermination factor NusB [Verrucomicrobiales bacterium]MCP5555539.1 transcription antitermination factor NusB [Akkermansiaceae bacterium]HRX53639.1 transcription antitermination factor NusB [Verrucomicrobiales bacterium]
MAKPGIRREGREAALQFLFSHDLNDGLNPEDVSFWELRPAGRAVKAFAVEMLQGVVAHLHDIDAAIAGAVENYSLQRIDAVDRNLLRLASYEILYREDIPVPVSINEAIEISKRFGTSESPRFINGVLDRIRRSLPSPQ